MKRFSGVLARVVVVSGAFAFAGSASVSMQGDPVGPTVRTNNGTVHGITVGSVEEFRGLPYAAPPVGDLRWRAPQPAKTYSGGVLQATKFPAPCMQGGNGSADLPPPSEDCLYLNLYRPAGSREGKRMPVLVYVHGGGFNGGTASARDGTPIAATNDTIVITINYRLGVFGWLSLPGLDAEAAKGSLSGNYGLLDMAAALRWVQENAAAFGGDRNNVTISGTSAGGIGVCVLMTVPFRETLLHRAIIQSGECTHSSGYITSHPAALRQGASVAAKAGCADATAFVSCLRSKSAVEVLKSSTGLGPFTATVGGHLMARAPIDIIRSGDMPRIPVIVGATHDEQRRSGLATIGFPGSHEGYQKYLANTFGTLASLVAAQYPLSAFRDPAYAAGAAASDSGVPNGIGVCPMLVELGGALAKTTTTFAYELNDPQGSASEGRAGNNAAAAGFEPGSQHTAEISFLFAQIAPGTRTPAQVELASRMQRYWATFARTGRPRDGTREWAPLGTSSQLVLRFQPSGDTVVEMTALSNEHRCGFWSQVGY